MGFWKTLGTGYQIMFEEINQKHGLKLPKIFAGSGTGLMMIASALFARQSLKEENRIAIEEARKAVEEAKKPVEGEKKTTRLHRIVKAKMSKGLKMAKIYRLPLALEAAGGGLVGIGMHISDDGRKKALEAAAVLGAEYAGYRAAVREDLGEAADMKYLTGKKAVNTGKTDKNSKNTGSEDTEETVETVEDENGVLVQKDPGVFKFWFDEKTCPSLWEANYDLRLNNLKWVESNLSRMYMNTWNNGGALTLNDMRREFGGLNPRSMDVDIGGIFGRVYDPNKPETKKLINLHFRDDEDFMEGRTTGCWIIFDCDPEPIIGRIGRKFTKVEE